MRRLKVIYLIPVALVLLIGAGFAFYYLLLKPQIVAVQDAQSSWATAKEDLKKLEPKYKDSLDDEVKSAQKLYADYYIFHEIQNTMPAIYDVKEAPLNELLAKAPAFKYDVKWSDDRKKLYWWYYLMATGQLVTELNKWTKGFHGLTFTGANGKPSNVPVYKYAGTLGFESSLPSVKLVCVDFGTQHFKAVGYQQLLKEIAAQTGYGYFPLIIDLGSSIRLTVDTSDPKYGPKTPVLKLDYTAKGYFFTHGWSPLENEQDLVGKAKDMIIESAETASAAR